jgi:hypothetical protein
MSYRIHDTYKIIAGLFIIVFFSCNVQTLYADRGSIPLHPNVQIFEPKQRAIIAWNGTEEILLLSTDMSASAKTKVLEIIPFPSEPVVSEGDVEIFRKAMKLVNEKLQKRGDLAAQEEGREVERGSPAGEVTFHQVIGANDVMVIHVLDVNSFIDWVKRYFSAYGVKNPKIPEALTTVIDEYLKEGYLWFVFDVVSLDAVPATREAIQYRFKTESLFYPLRISRTEEGETAIELLVLSQRQLITFPGISIEEINLPYEPIGMSSEDVRGLNEEMDSLLGREGTVKLRIWHIEGNLSGFKKDLLVK